MENRKEKRLPKVLNIKIEDSDHSYRAVMKDASKGGLRIKSDHVFPTYKAIDIVIYVNNKPIKLKGCVRWTNEEVAGNTTAADDQGIFSAENLNDIGVLLINPPKDYIEYIDTRSQSN